MAVKTMMQADYIKRNLRGFEGDEYLAKEIASLCEDFAIDTIVETGTYLGGTTSRFAEMAGKVITIEANWTNYKKAEARLKDNPKVQQLYGKSETILPHILKGTLLFDNILFFLDAHWGTHCPLLDELRAIAKSGLQPLIVIHDFYNPDHTDFGYDTYNGQRLDFEYIQPELDKIYLDGYEFYYNEFAEGGERGVIFIYPYQGEDNETEEE